MKTSTTTSFDSRVSGRPLFNLYLRPKTFFRLTLALLILLSGINRAAAQVAQENSDATPSLMLSFDAQSTGTQAQLTWVMENETNCKYFVIERSGSTGGYDSIGVVTGINNNNDQTTYTFDDPQMLNGDNYYRLRQVQMQGDFKYSKVIMLFSNQMSSLMSIYPNPAVESLNYNIASASNQQVIVQVYNVAGVALVTTQQQVYVGNNRQTIAISSLKSGNYFLKVTSFDGATKFVQSFVKIM
jgi:Secretion system C-terminal sorting domain